MTILRSVTAGGSASAPNEVLDSGIVTAVASVETVIAQVTLGTDKRIRAIECSGEVMARWRIYIDSVETYVKWTGAIKETIFSLNVNVSSGTLIEVRATHYRNDIGTAKMSAYILGF